LIHSKLLTKLNEQERLSAQWKQLFKDIQIREGVERPLQLLLNMPVQWSPTFTMLEHAETQQQVSNVSGAIFDLITCSIQYINTFINEMDLKEPNLDKWKKIGE
jgi:hypothetical protein